MLTLTMKESTQNGCQKNIGRIYTDYRFHTKFPHKRDKEIIYQFVLDQKVRYMKIIKDDLENLRAFPIITLDDTQDILEETDTQIDLTENYLKYLFEAIELYMGKLKYTVKRTKKEKGVLQYLEANGVEVKQE